MTRKLLAAKEKDLFDQFLEDLELKLWQATQNKKKEQSVSNLNIQNKPIRHLGGASV